MRTLISLFVFVPLLELYLLTILSKYIGFGATVAITLITGIVGSALAKREGLRAYRQWRRSLDAMQAPEVGLVEGVLILVGGVMLITPGVLTDLAGLSLLLPWTRQRLAKVVKHRVARYLQQHTIVVGGDIVGGDASRPPVGQRAPKVIEGAGESVDD